MKKQITIISVFIFFLFSFPIYSQKADSDSTDKAELETILKKCAEYCEKLANSALFFVCQEEIKEEINQGIQGNLGSSPTIALSGNITMRGSAVSRIIEKNVYIYDYQLIKKGEKIEETRILLKENGKKKYEKNAPLKTKRFYSKRSVMGPVGLFSKVWQDKYDYKIVKEETIKGRKSYVIEINPKTAIEGNPNHGKAWVDKEDFTVLKIEIKQESLAGFEKFEQEVKDRLMPLFTTTHHYFIEEKGIRFPSKTVFVEKYMGTRRNVLRASETTITYDNYKFFTVDVEVIYKSKI
jgi:hypothetical protein